MWIMQNIYSYSVDRSIETANIPLIYKMNKHFHNYTTQTRKVKENYGNKKEAPAGGFFFANV